MKERYKVTPAIFTLVYDTSANPLEVLLHRRANTGFRDGEYDVASGHLEPTELPPEGAARELLEEYGLIAEPKKLSLFHIVMNEADTPEKPYIYLFFKIALAACTGSFAIQEPDRCDDLRMFPVSDLPDVVPHVRTAIQNLNNDFVTFSRI